jgi:hypothetical protein
MAARKSTSAPAQPVQDAQPKIEDAPAPAAANGNPPAGGGKGTPPVWKKRFFSAGSFVEVAVFRHVADQSQQGSSHPTYSIALDRSYKDHEGRWGGTTYLRRDDLLVAAHALQRAYAWISEQETRDL